MSGTPPGNGDSRTRIWSNGTICWTSDSSRCRKSARRESRAGGGDRVGGRERRVDNLDEVQADLHCVAQVLKRDRHLLEGDEHAAGRSIRVGDGVGERLPRPLHRLPEGFKLVGFGPAEVRTFELELARADADVIPLLLLGVEAAEAVWTITGRSTEKPNGYCVVRGNVEPEFVTAGTVMRPMVSDMGFARQLGIEEQPATNYRRTTARNSCILKHSASLNLEEQDSNILRFRSTTLAHLNNWTSFSGRLYR